MAWSSTVITTHLAHRHVCGCNLVQVGLAGSERDVLQLPVSFTNTTQEEIPQEATAPGRNMMVAFHRSVLSPPQVGSLPCQARLSSQTSTKAVVWGYPLIITIITLPAFTHTLIHCHAPQHVPTKTGAAAVARAVRLEALREDLAEARREPELDMAALQGQR
jgi:hypothetical protein